MPSRVFMKAEVQKFAPNMHLWSGHSQVLLTGVSGNLWMKEHCVPGVRAAGPGLSTASVNPAAVPEMVTAVPRHGYDAWNVCELFSLEYYSTGVFKNVTPIYVVHHP